MYQAAPPPMQRAAATQAMTIPTVAPLPDEAAINFSSAVTSLLASVSSNFNCFTDALISMHDCVLALVVKHFPSVYNLTSAAVAVLALDAASLRAVSSFAANFFSAEFILTVFFGVEGVVFLSLVVVFLTDFLAVLALEVVLVADFLAVLSLVVVLVADFLAVLSLVVVLVADFLAVLLLEAVLAADFLAVLSLVVVLAADFLAVLLLEAVLAADFLAVLSLVVVLVVFLAFNAVTLAASSVAQSFCWV